MHQTDEQEWNKVTNNSSNKRLWELKITYCFVCFTDTVLEDNFQTFGLFLETDALCFDFVFS